MDIAYQTSFFLEHIYFMYDAAVSVVSHLPADCDSEAAQPETQQSAMQEGVSVDRLH